MEGFSREKLQELRKEAKNSATYVANDVWKRAYLQLMDAADRLDAMMARTEE